MYRNIQALKIEVRRYTLSTALFTLEDAMYQYMDLAYNFYLLHCCNGGIVYKEKNFPSKGDWLNKLQSIYTMKFHVAM